MVNKPLNFLDVVLPIPIDKSLTYHIEGDKIPIPFSRVLVPLGRRKEIGFVLRTHLKDPGVSTKPVIECLDSYPLISDCYAEWLTWASRYYMTPLGEVLATAYPNALLKPLPQDKISAKKTRSDSLEGHWIAEKEIVLNPSQEKILCELIQEAEGDRFAPSLLFGVTGSGKTEIYLRLIDHLLKKGREIIFLVPEIGLTPQVVARCRHFFGSKLGLFHSELTENQRLKEWIRAQSGEISLMVGTRSAIFTPFRKLGALIIDEEQDPSYKQEERFRYNARDLAVIRGKMENCPVLMGSATPSLESFKHGREGKYHLYELTERAGGAVRPSIQVVDMAAQKRQTLSPLTLSVELQTAIRQNLFKKEQTLILINRRGFARSALCLACRNSVTCPNCSVPMVYHKREKELLCHYCDAARPLPQQCPVCLENRMTLTGAGSETVEEELKTYFPEARVARLDRDATKKRGTLLSTLKDLTHHKIDILVGTQIIAKGHDIPRVTLVGVLGADATLGLPDFRAAERTFQLLTQVAGRAGRAELPGRVIVQSFIPQDGSIQLACREDYRGFAEKEMARREELAYPPKGRLISFHFSANSESRLKHFLNSLNHFLASLKNSDASNGVQMMGPAPSPIEKMKGRLRWHLLLKGCEINALHATARRLKEFCEKQKSGVKWAIDVDPVSML